MNQKSLKWGIGITLVWLIVIALFWFFGDLKSPESLNELGDALAGIFAPVAFLWLVLGYVQQGKQLEQNTKALEQQKAALQLQIEEIRESIKQQKNMLLVQQKDLDSKYQSVKPYFNFLNMKATLYKVQISNGIKAQLFVELEIENIGGHDAYEINVSVSNRIIKYIPHLKLNSKCYIESMIYIKEFNDSKHYGVDFSFEFDYQNIYEQTLKERYMFIGVLIKEDSDSRIYELYVLRNKNHQPID